MRALGKDAHLKGFPHLSTVIPQRPHNLHLVSRWPTELEVAWTPGLSGIYPLTHCTLQVRAPHQALILSVSAPHL